MGFDEIIHEVVTNQEKFVFALVAGAILVGMFIRNVARVFTGVSRERTKREIAAYVAEGSMTPEQGERILKAGDRRCM